MNNNDGNGSDPLIKERKKVAVCPNCSTELVVHFAIEMRGLMAASAEWEDTLTGDQRAVLQRAEDVGLFEPFCRTVAVTRPNNVPKSKNGYRRLFLHVFKNATPKRIPEWAVGMLKRELATHKFDVYGAEGILIVSVDKIAKLFIPENIVNGLSIKTLGARNVAGRIPADRTELTNWIKTRHGYVVGKGEFYAVMRNKAIGDFARPGL